jgi:peptidyl-prolyl cis-trans isomerase B (cyclophilin B)
MGRRYVLRALVALGLVLAATLGGVGAAWAVGGKTMVKLTTSKGEIVIELDKEKAPVTAENFLAYVKAGHYDGTVFHRVINGFMVQGGGMDKNMKEKPTNAPIANEADNGLKNKTYTVAMARTGDPHSATSQFFINVADNAFLDHTGKNAQGWGYAVFGKVVKGQEVVDAIKAVPTMTKGFYENVPVVPVVIEKAEVESE